MLVLMKAEFFGRGCEGTSYLKEPRIERNHSINIKLNCMRHFCFLLSFVSIAIKIFLINVF